jgi:hypothetical protein
MHSHVLGIACLLGPQAPEVCLWTVPVSYALALRESQQRFLHFHALVLQHSLALGAQGKAS